MRHHYHLLLPSGLQIVDKTGAVINRRVETVCEVLYEGLIAMWEEGIKCKMLL